MKMKIPNLTLITGGCRRTFIALVSIIGMFIFGYLKDIDVSNTVASVAIALAAANGAESVMTNRSSKKKEPKDEQISSQPENIEAP